MGPARSRELLAAVVQRELHSGCDRFVLRFDTTRRRDVRFVNSVLHSVNAFVDRRTWSVSTAVDA
jgi:hypothetical protein